MTKQSTWIEHFPGNLLWSNAVLMTKAMAPYGGSVALGEANDGTVTVASQLRQEAQRGAARLYGFNETHMGVLESAEVSALLNGLLRNTFAPD